MKRLISKLMIAALVAVFACSSVFGASAKVTYVKGKVEVSRGNEWVSLKVGDVVKEAETISTGFQSEARLNYNGSVMAVPALSRVTLEALQSSGNKEVVSIKVDTGAVRSKVTHTEGKRIEYTARTPVGVASVRGTDFAVFASGVAKVYSGAIAYYKASDFVMPELNFSDDEEGEGEESDSEEPAPDLGPATATTQADEIVDNAPKGAIVVGAGQSSKIDESGQASKPVVEAKKRTTKVKSAVSTAAAKDAMTASTSSSSTTSDAVMKPAIQKVKLSSLRLMVRSLRLTKMVEDTQFLSKMTSKKDNTFLVMAHTLELRLVTKLEMVVN